MFGRSFKLFTVFGFEIKIDLSWLVIAVLVAWSLESAFSVSAGGLSDQWPLRAFGVKTTGLSGGAYWIMGVAGALGLFASVVFHEVWHSLVARQFGLQMKGITLFIFGGVSELGEEPSSAKVEFWMALAGPLSSIFLSGLFFLLGWLFSMGHSVDAVAAVLLYMGYLNLLLAAFNIIPAFPLDGGRVLRAAIWAADKNMLKATHLASTIGTMFGALLIALGVLMFIGLSVPVLGGGVISGVWFGLIGWFLWNAARSAYQQVLLQKGLEGMKVSKLMESNPVTVPRGLSIQNLVDDYIYKHTFKLYPVVDGDRLLGCVTLQKVKDVPRSEWSSRSVGEIAAGCEPNNTVGPDVDAMQALSQMSRNRLSRLMVVEGDRLVGIITLKDMLKFLEVKLELGGAR